MAIVSLREAQADLADLLTRAEAGEEIVIKRENLPALRLIVSRQSGKTARQPGALANQCGDPPDDLFLRPLDEDELLAWEGKYSNDFH